MNGNFGGWIVEVVPGEPTGICDIGAPIEFPTSRNPNFRTTERTPEPEFEVRNQDIRWEVRTGGGLNSCGGGKEQEKGKVKSPAF